MEADQRLDQFNAQNLANTAWAFATVGQHDEQLFKAFRKALGAISGVLHWIVSRGGGDVAPGRGQATLLEPSWALLALISPHFFAFVVSFDFSSIFSRFWRGFGRVLGGQNGPKSIFWVFWGGFFSIPYFRSIFASFLRKLMRKNTWNFACFSIGCFPICSLKSLFSIMPESSK